MDLQVSKQEAALPHPLDALTQTLLASLSPLGSLCKVAGVQWALRTEITEIGSMECFCDFVIFNFMKLNFHRNSYRSQFCHMYEGLTRDQVGSSNRPDGGESA